MKTALFPGRFQPLHKGHVYALKNALKKYRLIILIGSTNRKDENNPFSLGLRKKMLEAVLAKHKKRYKIISLPDYSSDAEWAREAKRKAKFDLVISGSAWVRRCFPEPVLKPKMLNRRKYNATRIRTLMKKGKRWQHLVPREVAGVIEHRGL